MYHMTMRIERNRQTHFNSAFIPCEEVDVSSIVNGEVQQDGDSQSKASTARRLQTTQWLSNLQVGKSEEPVIQIWLTTFGEGIEESNAMRQSPCV
jgi:hypothetical protein